MPLTPNDIPSKCNEFFAEIGPKLVYALPDVDIVTWILTNNPNINVFEIVRTNIETVIKHIKKKSIYKSSGISDLGSRLLKIYSYISLTYC